MNVVKTLLNHCDVIFLRLKKKNDELFQIIAWDSNLQT